MFKYLLISMLMAGGNQHAKRTLLLFADNSSKNALKQQQLLLNRDMPGLQQRDIEIKVYTPKDADIWKRKYIRPGFTAILIGKDGGEKLRSHQPVTTDKLFKVIDVMPMRQDEMKHRYVGMKY